ncbi:hypothetical protein VBD025_03150 [Virgibacillus flavescens]|uniref:hypothetical protein n=1 Tax=Virgibacillus flavescens TaxID=1611422 RepID=UPI003D336896
MKTFLIGFILVFCSIVIIPQISFGYTGESSEIYDENVEFLEQGESVKLEGELSTPESVIEPDCIACVDHQIRISTVSGPTTTKRFVRYLTGSWAKSNNYTWSKTQSASSTLSANVGVSSKTVSSSLGVSNTVTTSYSVSISIPANSSYYSKLAFYSDYNKRYIKVGQYTGGKLLSTKYANHYAPRKDTYLQVVYQ